MKRLSFAFVGIFFGLVFWSINIDAQNNGSKIIEGGVLNGKAVNLVKPSYPPAARAVKASGIVSIQITIDEKGNVISAEAVSGHPLLREAGVTAAKESTFTPTFLRGRSVKVTGSLIYNFYSEDKTNKGTENKGPAANQISENVLNGEALNLPIPEYPPSAKAVKASGLVRVQVIVDESGNVISAAAISGHPLLLMAAEKAAKDARFSPTMLEGKPVIVTGLLIYNFAATDGKTVNNAFLNSRAIKLFPPEYPPAAKAVKAGGTVNVQVTVDEEGNVISAKAISGHPLLRQSAEKAAKEAKFAPTILGGRSVKVTGIIVYNFMPPGDHTKLPIKD